jgi:hypothetical protein
VCSVAVETVVTLAAVAGKPAATPGPAPTCGEGAAATAASSSRPLFELDIVQLSAQHGIDACIDTISLSDLPTQHAAAPGNAVANSTSASVTDVTSRFIIDVLAGCTLS